MNYFVIKLQSPFERLKFINDNPEISFRKAIILQAIIDASSCSEKQRDKKIAQEARDWLFGNSEYFQELCNESELAPNYVANIAAEMIKIQEKKINKNKDKKVDKIQKLLTDDILVYSYYINNRYR